ncbi:MAG: 7-cyano-7-deazaguanine synthase QueC [Gemmatimonadales bacterium]
MPRDGGDAVVTRPAVVLLSGGLDSAVTLALARHQGFTAYAMSFRYGQRHQVELSCAAKVAAALGATRHLTIDIDLLAIGGSALTSDLAVPKDRPQADVGEDIPITYVPARNTIFLSFGLAWAEVLGAHDLFIGVNALDYSGYPDCRPEYISAFERMARLATRAGVEGAVLTVHAPLIDMSKQAIIARGLELGMDFSLTSSCYDPTPEGLACGRCDACRLRLKGFAENGISDPVGYDRASERAGPS